MRGITFGTPYFETELGRVEPDSEIHFAVALYAASSDADVGVPRDELASILWPESTLDAARHNLRQAMYRLRQLGVPVHLKVGQVIMSDTDTEIDLRELVHGPVTRDDLLRIATLEFLPGYSPRLGPRYAAWLQDLRDRTDRVRRHALVEAVREARTQARFRDIHKLAPALLSLDPLNETATLALAEALVMEGSKVEALRMLDEYEQEVGSISNALRIPVRTLRRRVSECLDDALLPRQFEVPFVGRDTEFRLLREGFVATRHGKGQCFVVTGEAGIGKTRIAQELLRLSVLDGAMVISYSCTSGDAITPLSSLLALISALLCQPGALGCASEHLQYLRRVQNAEASLAASDMAADIAYAQLVYSLAELAAAISDEGPLVLFVDDAHRLHKTSWRIFGDVVDRLPNKRVLLILAARQLPEWYADLGINGSDGRRRHIPLAPFSQGASRSFLDLWSEKNAANTPFDSAARVADAAGGNPFYLGELLAHVARGGVATEAPASIKGLVQLQYSTLTKPAQRALLITALLQAHTTIARILSVLRVGPTELVGALEELETAGMIALQGTRLVLRHDLIGDVALGLAPATVVQYLRTRVAARLEREGRRAGSVELLNDAMAHWDIAEASDGAFRSAMALGERLLSMGLSADATVAFEKARERATSTERSATALLSTIRALSASADWDTLRQLSTTLGDEHIRTLPDDAKDEVALALQEAEMWVRSCDPDFGMLEKLFSDSSRSPSVRFRAALIAVIAADNAMRGEQYISQHWQAIEQISASARDDQRLLLRLITCVATGQVEESVKAAEALVSHARPRSQGERARLVRQAAHAMLRIGRTLEAISLFQAALEDARSLRLPVHQSTCLEKLTAMYFQLGEFEAADEANKALRAIQETAVRSSLLYNSVFEHEARLAFAFKDKARAAAVKSDVASCFSEEAVGIQQNAILFAMASLLFAFPDLLDERLAHWARTFDRRVLGRGVADFAVTTVVNALLQMGDPAAAVELVQDYFLNHRIERGSPAPRVWALIQSDAHPVLSDPPIQLLRAATQLQ